MTDDEIKEAARRLERIAYHQREIEDHECAILAHQRQIDAEREAIETLRSPK